MEHGFSIYGPMRWEVGGAWHEIFSKVLLYKLVKGCWKRFSKYMQSWGGVKEQARTDVNKQGPGDRMSIYSMKRTGGKIHEVTQNWDKVVRLVPLKSLSVSDWKIPQNLTNLTLSRPDKSEAIENNSDQQLIGSSGEGGVVVDVGISNLGPVIWWL